MKRDERLRRSIYDAVVDGDAQAAEALERELAGRPDLLAELRELKALWDDLASVPGPEVPGDARERALKAALAELQGRRASSGRGARIWWSLGAAAAAVLLFVGGFLVGSSGRPAPTPEEGAEYAFIIRGRVQADVEAEVASRMADWARDLAREDRLALAERLVEDSMLWVGPRRDDDGREPPVSGLFLVRAANLEEAERLARAAPHLSYGGAVEILPVAGH